LRSAIARNAATLQLIKDDPNPKLLQVRLSSLKSGFRDIAFDKYALGFPLDEIRVAFAETAAGFLRMFELRGTGDAFPVAVLTVDPTKAPEDPAYVIGDRWRPELRITL
jgi:hypothetical protein